jgi:hypothetical protein
MLPLMGLWAVAGMGMVINAVLLLWKVITGYFRQAAAYGLGMLPLAGVFFWLHYNLHFEKISG